MWRSQQPASRDAVDSGSNPSPLQQTGEPHRGLNPYDVDNVEVLKGGSPRDLRLEGGDRWV